MQKYPLFILFVLIMWLLILPVSAQDDTNADNNTDTVETTQTVAENIILNNATTDDSTVWFIEGEPSLVMNGFDLTPLDLELPIFVEAIRISVVSPVPGIPLDAVLYVDENGGSPQDAQLVEWTRTTIDSAGVARIEFPDPVAINAPVLWAGFYLPVDFEFRADTSGSSVLTYWAWQPGGVFDLVNLNTAPVFGPADGSAPVEIDMGGVARITVELFNPASDPDALQRIAPLGVQIAGPADAPLSTLISYPTCGEILYDPNDIAITGSSAFNLNCRTDIPQDGPGLFWNFERVEAGIDSFERHGRLYDITGFGNYVAPNGQNTELVVPVTHCMTPEAIHLDTAVLAVAYGAPQRWEIMPTARYGNLVCAELKHVGMLSYFTPRDPGLETLNANLYFTVPASVYEAEQDIGAENFANCGRLTSIRINMRNDGFELTPATTIRLQDFSVRTGELIAETVFNIPIIAPGETYSFTPSFVAPELFVNEQHRIVLTLDPGGVVAEDNEGDNVQVLEYALQCK
jgi:hypothetical protein